LSNGLGRGGEQDVEAMLPRLGDYGPQGADGDPAFGADDAGARDTRAKLRHLDVVGNVHELVPNDVGDEHMNRVAADVDSGEPHNFEK
jgi:hypothetical protein